MVALLTQKDFRGVRELPFCYLCGKGFLPADETNRDHVPPQKLFAETDRQPALILKTHKACNSAQSTADNKIGQLLKLKRGKIPSNPSDRILEFALFPRQGMGAVMNVAIDEVVWRWIRGLHAALYRQPFPPGPRVGALVTPFPRAHASGNDVRVEDIKVQHLKCVAIIKANRARNNLDRIHSNNGNFVYESVWVQAQADGVRSWICVFAMNLYDWKVLGTAAPLLGRGCAGWYRLPQGEKIAAGTTEIISRIQVPNYEPLNPFGG